MDRTPIPKSTEILSPIDFSPRGLISSIWKADRLAVVGIVVANFLPILIAIICGWGVSDVVLFYWWENIVIGVYAMLRILTSMGGGKEMQGAKLFLVPFFCFHYFFFCFIHVTFIRVFFSDDKSISSPFDFVADPIGKLGEILPVGGWVGIIGLLISYGVSFTRGYILNGKYKQSFAFAEMFRPYGRIVILHIGIIFGGFLLTFFGAPLAMVVFLMLLKTVFDLAAFSFV